MGTGYVRNDSANNIADGNVINAADLDGEFDAVQAAFNASTGHSHDGTTGEGPQITSAGLASGAVTSGAIANDSVALGTKTTGNYVAAGAVSGTGLSGSASAEGATFTVTSNATDANTASTIVARDASGNFAAGTITANLTGTASDAALLDSLDSTQFLRSDAADTKTAGDLSFADNVKAQFGAGNDLQIYHDGSQSVIRDFGSGHLRIQAGDLRLENADGTATYLSADNGAALYAYHNGNVKLTTTATGVDVTGGLNTTGNVGIGGSETTVFNGVGGDMKFVVIGDDSTTTLGNNSDAGIAIVNTNQTAGNLAGLHFARADTDDTPNYAGASIVAQFPEAQVTGQYPKSDLAFLTSTATNSAPSEKMRLTASGSVGIGQSNPTSPNGATDFLHIGNSSNQDTSIVLQDGVEIWEIYNNDDLLFNFDTTNVMTLQRVTGNVGIGISSPSVKLDVAGTVFSSDGKFGLDSTDYMQFVNNSHLGFVVNGGEEARLEADGDLHVDGDVIAFSTTISDERLKTDITKIGSALDKVKQLNGYTFTYKADGKQSAGVIAQEVEKVLPSAVAEKQLPLKTDDEVSYKTVQYDQLVGLLIEAVNELQAKVAKLEEK